MSLAITAATIASYLPFPIVGELGDVALYALGEQSGEELAVSLAIGLIPGGKLLGPLGSFLGKIRSRVAGSQALRGQVRASAVLQGIDAATFGLASRSDQFIKRAGCFDARTPVWTSAGVVPIEDVNAGHLVVGLVDGTGEPVLGTVLARYARQSAPIVEVVVGIGPAHADTLRGRPTNTSSGL